MKALNKELFLKRLFNEIVDGYSSVSVNDSLLYIKHIDIRDEVRIGEIYEEVYEQSRKRGIPTEEEQAEINKKTGMWTDKEERLLLDAKDMVDTLKKTLDRQVVEAQKKEVEAELTKEFHKYNLLYRRKDSLLQGTCERFAMKKLNDYHIFYSYYNDREFKSPVFTEEQIKEIDDDDFQVFFSNYEKKLTALSLDNIKKIAISGFFQQTYNLCEKPNEYFLKPLYSLTVYQNRLLGYGSLFKSIFQSQESIPEDVQEDPDKLLEWVEFQKNTKGVRERAERGATIVGASSEDYKKLGINNRKNALLNKAREQGGMEIGEVVQHSKKSV